MKPRVLDLFCGAGGAGAGYARAGYDVVGIDISPQPNYPFLFIQGDALAADPDWIATFDLVHASPPCQPYSDLAHLYNDQGKWPLLVERTRDLIHRSTDGPYVIENVDRAPLKFRLSITLCGTQFPGLRVIRHRVFESNVPLRKALMPHPAHPFVFTHDRRKAHHGKLDQDTAFVSVTGGGNCTIDNARDAMGIDWPMTKAEINEAIPPAYTEWIGKKILETAGRNHKIRGGTT